MFVRYVVAPTVAAYANWDSIEEQFQRIWTDPEPEIHGRYAQFIFGMKDGAGAWTPRERGMYGIHYINTTGSDPDDTWVTADFTSVESAMGTFWGAIPGYISTDCRLEEVRWYKFGPGITAPNPPVRTYLYPTPPVGTQSAGWPRQVAMTVTLKTTLRKHWGRVYLPISPAAFATNGQASAANVDGIATAFRTFLTGPETAQGVTPVVYDRARKSMLGVTELQVDSVPDVVRRRRARTTIYRKQFTS